MNIAKLSIERPLNTWLIVVICLLGGIWGFNTVGKLEDPAFTIPNAIINTPYPGATAVEVEEEVTERLERAIQEMEQIDVIKSKSLPGRSEIQVEVHSSYSSHELPQIWDELRNKINDAQGDLPEGVLAPRSTTISVKCTAFSMRSRPMGSPRGRSATFRRFFSASCWQYPAWPG